MTEPEPSAPEVGEVRRRGNDLLVLAPAAISRSAWLALEQDLQMHAGAVSEGDRELYVHVDRAADLREVLERPWPAGRFSWAWSPDAVRSTSRAVSIKESVDSLLAEDPHFDLDQIDGDLAGSGFSRRLLPAQRAAVAKLVAAHGGGNFSVPGSGKTTMTYAVYTLLRRAGLVDRMLVIAPQSAYEAWSEEARDCFSEGDAPSIEIAPQSPRRRSEVLVLNYERAAMGGVRARVDGWAQGHRFLVVFDEAHRAKRGSAGLHGQGALDLAGFAEARLVLTGTPMPNGPADLVAVLDLAWPGQGERLASSQTPHADRSWVRITKGELELDDADVVIERVRLDDSHARLYEALADGLLSTPEAKLAHPEFAEKAIMRLIACASNPMLLTGAGGADGLLRWPEDLPMDAPISSLLDNLTSAARPAKLLAAARHAETHANNGTKLLVWTNFIGNVRELERMLEPYGTAVITGATPRSDAAARTDRERELHRFRDDPACTVLIATPQTLGEGVSLHKACQAQLHVDRTFNAGLYLQAMDRTHRVGMPLGTTAKVTVLKAIGTIDERIDRALRQKIEAMDCVLNDPNLARLSKVTMDATSVGFTAAELSRLLAHIRG